MGFALQPGWKRLHLLLMLGWEGDISYLKAWPAAFKKFARGSLNLLPPLCPQRVGTLTPFFSQLLLPEARYRAEAWKTTDAQSYKTQAGGRISQTVGGCNSNSIRRSAGFRRSRTFSVAACSWCGREGWRMPASPRQYLTSSFWLPSPGVLSSPSPSMKWKYPTSSSLGAVCSGLEPAECACHPGKPC